jgi:phosphoglycerol transferase MdoB-like AlkP superfamily enzyme
VNEPQGAPLSKPRALLETYLRPLVVLAAHLAAFTLARLAIVLLYPEDFSTLPARAHAAAFLRGLRYDASALFPFLGLPLLLLLLPFPWARTRRWQQAWGWVCFGLFVLFSFTLAGDVVYFGSVHRHAGLETAAVGETFKAVTSSAFHAYLLPLAVFVLAAAGLFWGWKRLLQRDLPPPIHFGGQLAFAVVALILMYYGERGTLSGKRLRAIHAFQDLPGPAAHLALNGPYCILHSLVHARAVKADFYPWPEAVRTAQEALFAPGETAADPEFPLLRAREVAPSEKPNVVVIMLESWDAFAVDAQRREMGLAPLGFTPCFDALSREGLLFTRFYASGQRSMDGMSALLCGFPTLPGTSYLGRGLEQSSLTGLGHLGRREGYETWFIQASERDSFRCDAIAPRLGFDRYLGGEDSPPEPPAASRGVLRGACWDHEMFAEANRRLSSARRPFVAFLYSNTTHLPFFWPDDRWKKRSGDSLEDRYLNSLGYCDWALGRFFDGAKAAGWFHRTIFILTADHLGGPGGGTTADDPATRHHVPCLILAPGLKPGIDRRIGSQLDVIPTIAALAGWGTPQAALGCSLFGDPASGRGALCVEGSLVLRVEEGGFVVHDLTGRVAGKPAVDGGDLNAIERRLLSITQAAYTLLRTNRVAR